MIEAQNVTFEYIRRDEDGNVSEIVEAVKNLSLQIQPGEFVGILGRNGSGKSTFAKMLNALLEPTEGSITISGMDTKDSDQTLNIRKKAGMVFQNPDNQIIGTMVEEDVAFGPENLGVATKEIISRVTEALETVGMTAFREASPNRLSGGQKQRVAIAGVLSMQPRCIIFDESTSMLDPQGRREVLQAAHELNRKQNITILFITHDMDEVIEADRVVVIHEGSLVMEGTPQAVFAEHERLQAYGLRVPHVTELALRLQKQGIPMEQPVLTIQDLLKEINRKCWQEYHQGQQRSMEQTQEKRTARRSESERQQNAMTEGLVVDHVSYVYDQKTVYAQSALRDVSLTIGAGEFVALVGHTGSGKSTLIQHFNGLLCPTEGRIYYKGQDIHEKGYQRTALRGEIGLVFQYPEYQLFAETVLEDVCFGPKNLGLPLLEVQQRAFEAIATVGLPDSIYDMSPFELSGGQKRRVAIAGVLAMKPKVLVLDEPVAGLDPIGRKELLDLLKRLNRDGMTIVLVSHDMNDVAEYADRMIVMGNGQVLYDDLPEKVFQEAETMKKLGLDIPYVTQIMELINEEGHPVRTNLYRMQDAVAELTTYLRRTP